MEDELPGEVKLQQAEAYAALLGLANDHDMPAEWRVKAARSVLQFSSPGYFMPAEDVEDYEG